MCTLVHIRQLRSGRGVDLRRAAGPTLGSDFSRSLERDGCLRQRAPVQLRAALGVVILLEGLSKFTMPVSKLTTPLSSPRSRT